MWAIARIDLRLTDSEFWGLTPKLFESLLARKRTQDKREDIRTGIIAAAVVNFSMCHPDKMVSPMDFVPRMPGEEDASPNDISKMDPKQLKAHFRSMFSKKTTRRRGR